jgi:hypothetical protein
VLGNRVGRGAGVLPTACCAIGLSGLCLKNLGRRGIQPMIDGAAGAVYVMIEALTR